MKRLLLFQGDSVTDTDRNREDGMDLGKGYVQIIGDHLRNEPVTVLNRGISGNRSRDLVARWEEDCIQLRPDVLTILIGINDVWRKYDSNDETPLTDYEAALESIVSQAATKCDCKIILMEPFVLPSPPDRIAWRKELDPEIQVVRKIAHKYHTSLVPLDGLFAQAAVKYGDTSLCADGVHPTTLGHQLICKAWLDVYRELNLT